MKTDDLVKSLGDVRIRFYEGIFEANSQGVTAHGTFADGAIWNVLRLLKEQQESRKKSMESTPYGSHDPEADTVPTAGQDSTF